MILALKQLFISLKLNIYFFCLTLRELLQSKSVEALWHFSASLIVQLEALRQMWNCICSAMKLKLQPRAAHPTGHSCRAHRENSAVHLRFPSFILSFHNFWNKSKFLNMNSNIIPLLKPQKTVKERRSDTFLLCFPRLKPCLYWNIQKFPSHHRHQTLHFPVREELTLLSTFRQLSSPSDIVSSFDCCWATPEAMESGQNLCTGRFWAVFFFVFGVSEQLESSIGWRIRLLALINLNTIEGKVNLGPTGSKFCLVLRFTKYAAGKKKFGIWNLLSASF